MFEPRMYGEQDDYRRDYPKSNRAGPMDYLHHSNSQYEDISDQENEDSESRGNKSKDDRDDKVDSKPRDHEPPTRDDKPRDKHPDRQTSHDSRDGHIERRDSRQEKSDRSYDTRDSRNKADSKQKENHWDRPDKSREKSDRGERKDGRQDRKKRDPDNVWNMSPMKQEDNRHKRDFHNAPPPITLRESQQNTPAQSNFVSLKRPASTLSKADSHESPASDKNEDHSAAKDSTKETFSSPNKAKDLKDLAEDVKKTESPDAIKPDRDTKSDTLEKTPKNEQRDRNKENKQDREHGDRSHPPAKRMRDEPPRDKYDNRSDRYDSRQRNAPRGSREFVRGTSRSRGRGRGGRGSSMGERGFGRPERGDRRGGAVPGRGRSNEFRYDNDTDRDSRRDDMGHRRGAATYADQVKPFSMGNWGDTEEVEEVPNRRRDKDDESDLSTEEVSSVSGDSTAGRAEVSVGHGKDSIQRDSAKPHDGRRESQPRDKGGRRSVDEGNDERYPKDPRSPRGDEQFIPKGEPSRRGRGGSAMRGGRGSGRGARDDRRYNSAPPTRGGGFGRPPNKEFRGPPEDQQYRSDNRRDRRGDRASPPPRFARGRGERGGGFERGRGRGRGRGGPIVPNSNGRNQPLAKQNSSEAGVDDWETASESSDVNERRDSKNDLKDGRDKQRDQKKSFSSQRPPQGDRGGQNRRMNASDQNSFVGGGGGGNVSGNNSNKNYENPKNFHKERMPNSSLTKNGYATPPKNGRGGGKRPPHSQTKRDSMSGSQVFRVDGIVPNDQAAIDSALSSGISEKGKFSKKGDLTDVSKPLKSEKKREDALANIDLTNIAGVVVIDNVPDVTIDDPAFLYESNEGFQEVQSRKTIKNKQKAQEAEIRKLAIESQEQAPVSRKSKDVVSKVVAKPKGVHTAADKTRNFKHTKLPPRFAKQREQLRGDKGGKPRGQDQLEEDGQSSGPFMSIGNWDNTMSNNIPTVVSGDGKQGHDMEMGKEHQH
ncbi:hypothetical protein DPMN_133862 [Dreissena polymorpha]|uniref:Uncharacterized protein n=1 Tax=Dreissena polymorpha TaxID=45954 RepID=A0A9D4FYR5_DREPO|nr:hypothetical protein DPMN_133862 [Dreissena polymorpha]